MGTWVTTAALGQTITATTQSVRVLRWTFRREDETVLCELGLNSEESAYELRLTPPWNMAGTIEVFDDAMSAFERHASIERTLVRGGWMLEEFESQQIRRAVV
jgi:hypothetical protein